MKSWRRSTRTLNGSKRNMLHQPETQDRDDSEYEGDDSQGAVEQHAISQPRPESEYHAGRAKAEQCDVETTRKPKWCQLATEITRVRLSSSSRVARDRTRIPT